MNISDYMPDNSTNNPKSTEVQNLLIVDPNPCGSSLINTEDLSISVELEVFRRSDDIIIFDDSNDTTSVTNSINPSETTRISFIDGSGDDKKFLTTKYTELTTKFGKENDELGTLGIESIDISFNTSYTPIVKIKFKDIRGQLFQMGNDSPYSFLFRMPYPIFYLTVKGYFGKPVRYALHLTKFNGALDGDSGSFIITCDFIGYTYAFLSDILMGFLKAIPYTNQAKNLLPTDFVTFDDLKDIILELEKFILKYKQNDEKLRALTIYGDLASKLDAISGELKRSISLNGNNSVVLNENGLESSKLISYTLESDDLTPENEKTYEDTVFKLIQDYNSFTKSTKAKVFELDEDKFKLAKGGVYYKNFRLSDFTITQNSRRRFISLDEFQNFINNGVRVVEKYPNFKLLNNIEKDNIIEKLYTDFQKILSESPFTINNLNNASTFNMLDLRFAIQNINDLRTRLNNELSDKKAEVTEDFVSSLATFLEEQNISYDGSIGSLFKILTQHVDLFIRTIRKVGTAITSDIISGNRNIDANSINNFSDGLDDGNGTGPTTIKAFPEYVEKEENGLVEKWLGSNPKFGNFKEVDFIDDFYNAILKSAIKEDEFSKDTNINEKGWYPVNPLETKALDLSNTNPWLIPENTNQFPIGKLLYERMITYLGYTNKTFNNVTEIDNMAFIEANQAFTAIKNSSIKNSIIPNGASVEDINNKITFFSKELSEKYGISLNDDDDFFGVDTVTYRHLSSGFAFIPAENALLPSATYIPITQSINQLEDSSNVLNDASVRENYSGTFISTVVSNAEENIGVPNSFENETFIKILEPTQYNNSFTYEPYTERGTSNLTDTISSNEVDISIKNDGLGGVYKTHEFINYKHPKVNNLPLFYEFYEEGNEVLRSYRNKTNNEYDTYLETEVGFIYNPDSKLVKTNNDKQKIESLYDNKTLKGQLIENHVTKNTINRAFKFEPTFKSSGKKYSLFGSELYYSQSDIGAAFLFLHTIPFAGLGKNNLLDKGLLQGKEINFFNQRGGFVSVPYSWILFLGALIYRSKQDTDILVFNNTDGETFIPNVNGSVNIEKNAYLTSRTNAGGIVNDSNMSFSNNATYNNRLNDIITNLPESVKEEFSFEFENWVDNANGWVAIKNKLEIFSESTTRIERASIWTNFNSNSPLLNDNLGVNYSIVSKTNLQNTFFLDIRDNSPASDIIVDFLFDNRIILNSTYRIWEGSEDRFKNFEIPKSNVIQYLQTFLRTFSELNKDVPIDPIQEINNKIFKTNNVDDIKLSLYKNIKSIYDKWIVGIPQGQEGVVVTNLFDRFKFIDRSYADIASKFKVAPTGFIDFWSNNTNVSFYNFIARILRDNNFDFIPLPTYIDYSSQKEVRDVFKPFRFNEALPTNGPQFICMYFGEQSSKLNIDKNSKFKKNDSFSIDARCEDDNIVVRDYSELPDDFKEENNKIPYVLVNYADQNQSMFKSFSLDQSEFVETQESLEIIESLSNQNRNNSIGQNLFDIYNNRSYSAEIEMLGCAQMQPFMYFQLNNVPMFDGAYTVINTRHRIKPNHMTTTFKGVRIRSVKTKMVDDETLYAHLIGNLNEVNKENADFSAINRETNTSSTQSDKIDPAVLIINGVEEQVLDGIVIEG